MSQMHEGTDRSLTYSTPRWVKVFGILLLLLVLLAIVVFVTGLGGEHGPGRHTTSGDSSNSTLSVQQDSQLDAPAGHTPPVDHGAQQP